MSNECETVKVKAEKVEGNENGYIVINKEDFDAEKHALFDEQPKQVAAPAQVVQPWKPQ